MLLVCAETVIKGIPQLTTTTHSMLEQNCIFMLEPSLGTVMPVGVSWETLAQRKTMCISPFFTIHKI